MVDHQTDRTNIDRHHIAAMILEATAKGQALLQELVTRFDCWFDGA
jgi:hypothetical protein